MSIVFEPDPDEFQAAVVAATIRLAKVQALREAADAWEPDSLSDPFYRFLTGRALAIEAGETS